MSKYVDKGLFENGIVPEGCELDVYVILRPNLFKVSDNLYSMLSVGFLESLFHEENYTNSGSVTWFFPERFLNIEQQRELLKRAFNAGFTKIQITTESLFIIQSVRNDHIKLVNANMDETTEYLFSRSGNVIGLPDDSVLGVIGGTIVKNNKYDK